MAEAVEQILRMLYEGFLLRDLAGKVVPGSIVFAAVILGIGGAEGVDKIMSLSGGMWVIVGPLLWLLGLAAQGFGKRVGLVHYSLKYRSVDDHYRARRVFLDNRKEPYDRRRMERFEAIRETNGNSAAAIVLAIPIWLLMRLPSWITSGVHVSVWQTVIGIIIAIAFLYILNLGHRQTLEDLDAFWYHAIKDFEDKDSK